MCEKNFKKFWCYAFFLLIVSLSKSEQSFMSNEEKNNNITIRHELDSITNYDDKMKTPSYDLYEKTTNNTQYDNMQNESRITSMSNDDEDSNISNIVLYETCQHDNITCIQLCCPPGNRLNDSKCIPEKIKYVLPNVYKYTNDSLQSENKTVDELFQLIIYDPCKKNRRLLPYGYQYDYTFFANGSLYLSYYKIFAKSTSYCLAIIEGDKFEVIICSETLDKILNKTTDVDNNNSSIKNIKIIHVSFHIVSILFLVSLFLVYSILPDLRNVHAFMLHNYSGTLSVAYTLDIANILIKSDAVGYPICVTLGIVYLNHIIMQSMQHIFGRHTSAHSPNNYSLIILFNNFKIIC